MKAAIMWIPIARDRSRDPRSEESSSPPAGLHDKHRHDRRRVRQRPGSSSSLLATTTAAAVVLSGLLGGRSQAFVHASTGGRSRVESTTAAFIVSMAKTRHIPSSLSEPVSLAHSAARSFNRCFGHEGGDADAAVTSRRSKRVRRERPLHLVSPHLSAADSVDKGSFAAVLSRAPPSSTIEMKAATTRDSSSSGTTNDSATPRAALPPRAVPASTRLEFLKQSSVAVALAAGAAIPGLLIPGAPAAAALPTPTTAPARSGAGAAMAKDMVWLDEDSGTVSTRLSLADETYGQEFVAYLARILLNYDEGCREYFSGQLDVLVPRRDGSHIWDEFRGFAASVGLGLHRFQGAQGAQELCESLSSKYATREHEGAAQQLAVLFALLPSDLQPVAAVKSLLLSPAGSAAPFRGVELPSGNDDLDVSAVLGESPNALLPKAVRPRYDESAKAFYIPGVQRQLDDNGMGMAFGSRGPFPISKERTLTAVDFALFAACGAVGCTSTHLTVVPLDVVKTRLQTDPGRYEGLKQGVVTIAREEGWPMLLQGLGPTLVGYLWYGITVYPGYELFKRLFTGLVGPLNAALFRVPLVLAAGAAATCFACIGVCPAEAVRIRQVADPAVGDMPSAVRQIVAESGWAKLYDGLPSILFRQISFGMMKFLVFDFFTEFVYGVLPFLAEQTATQLSVSLTSGLVAGVCAAIVSQPADTVLSILNRESGRASIPGTVRAIIDERGIEGLFLGLQSRIVWSGAIISGQFLLYDVCKTALHVSADDLKVFLDAISSAGL